MLENIRLGDLLFIDIETVSASADFESLDPRARELWERKAAYLCRDGETAESIYARASIYAEFGKIICISCGAFVQEEGRIKLRIKSFHGHDERQLLQEFSEMLLKGSRSIKRLCAHNGKEFDFPYIARRALVNGLPIPRLLDTAGKKPWEVPHLDTMELWRFGDFKHFTSLDLLTYIFQIPTPKEDIDGSQVGEVYWRDGDLDRIVAYCQKDVVATANLFLRYRSLPIVVEEDVYYLT